MIASARWAVFISGRGSNAEAFFENSFENNVVLCVSSKAVAYGLVRAKRNGIASLILDKKIDWSKLDLELRRRNVTHIMLLGFMRLLPEGFVQLWRGKIWNLHPSLLPAFPGKDAIENSYQAKANMGVTVHEVIAEMDAGKKCFQYQTLNHQEYLQKGSMGEVDLAEAKRRISVAEQRLVRECGSVFSWK